MRAFAFAKLRPEQRRLVEQFAYGVDVPLLFQERVVDRRPLGPVAYDLGPVEVGVKLVVIL